MERNESSDESKIDNNIGRGNPSKGRPWLWIEKGIVKSIREMFGSTAPSAVAVYVALAEIASDAHSDTFTRSIGEIAARSRVSYRTASTILNGFEALTFISIVRNTIPGTKLQAPSTYTLCNYCLAVGNRREQPSLPRKNKSTEKSQKNNDDKRARETGAAQSPNGKSSSSSVLVSDLEEAKTDPLWPQFEDYCESENGAATLKGWNTWRPKQSQRNGAQRKRPRRELETELRQVRDARTTLLKKYGGYEPILEDRMRHFRDHAPAEAQKQYDNLRIRKDEIDQLLKSK